MENTALMDALDKLSTDEYGRVMIESEDLIKQIVGAHSEGFGSMISGAACSNGGCR